MLKTHFQFLLSSPKPKSCKVLCKQNQFTNTDFCDIYSPALDAAWDGDELTLAGWVKLLDVSEWTNNWFSFFQLLTNSDNKVNLGVLSTDGFAWMERRGGAVNWSNSWNMGSTLGWFHIAITVSVLGDEQRGFINGVQVDGTRTGLGAWAGALLSSQCVIGAQSTTFGEIAGWFADCALWKRALTPAEVLDVATI